jgi:antirestriction protein ArdC
VQAINLNSTTIFNKAVNFLENIGIAVHFKTIDYATFLPGISIECGEIIIDSEKLLYPGDILHEAGHIAVVPAVDRSNLDEHNIEKREQREAEEMMAIAWSYAVCVHLGIDATFVFHDEGYKNGGSHIAESFNQGHYFGVPMLQWIGMALERKNEEKPHLPIYPKMIKWLRD